MYALTFSPVTSDDTGTYLCFINNRMEPDSPIHLTVEGKCVQDFNSKLRYFGAYLINKVGFFICSFFDISLKNTQPDIYTLRNIIVWPVIFSSLLAKNKWGKPGQRKVSTFFLAMARKKIKEQWNLWMAIVIPFSFFALQERFPFLEFKTKEKIPPWWRKFILPSKAKSYWNLIKFCWEKRKSLIWKAVKLFKASKFWMLFDILQTLSNTLTF